MAVFIQCIAKSLIPYNAMATSNAANHTAKKIPWWQIDLGDEARESLWRVINSRSFSMGSATHELEQSLAQYLNVKHCVAVTNGTSALLVALIALGIKPKDEIVIQDRTWIASANAANILGATIKLADVNSVPLFSPNPTPPPLASVENIEKLISKKTKAIIISHMNGRALSQPELDKIQDLKIPVIEDAAQALGSQELNGRYLGTRFTAGCFSLAMTKLISAGQGGFVVTNNDDLAQHMRMSRTQGVEQVFDATWAKPGLNLRMTDLHSSIALSQVKKIPSIFGRQKHVLDMYHQNMKNNSEVSLVGKGNGLIEIGPYVECVVKNRKSLLEWLNFNGVEARPFYPNLASAGYINSLRYRTPNAEMWGMHGVYLPSGPGISDEEIKTVCQLINQFFSEDKIESAALI